METQYDYFEDLWIWKEGMNLCDEVYEVVQHMRDFGLKDQMQRSSVSIPSNIAEGYELGSNKGLIRHLYIAKGSGGGLRTQLYIALRRKFIPQTIGEELIHRAKRLNGGIANFIKERKKQKRPK